MDLISWPKLENHIRFVPFLLSTITTDINKVDGESDIWSLRLALGNQIKKGVKIDR